MATDSQEFHSFAQTFLSLSLSLSPSFIASLFINSYTSHPFPQSAWGGRTVSTFVPDQLFHSSCSQLRRPPFPFSSSSSAYLHSHVDPPVAASGMDARWLLWRAASSMMIWLLSLGLLGLCWRSLCFCLLVVSFLITPWRFGHFVKVCCICCSFVASWKKLKSLFLGLKMILIWWLS